MLDNDFYAIIFEQKNIMQKERPAISVTVDIVLFKQEENKTLFILLIRRRNEPFQNAWALPGGFVEADEDLETAARRELEEETGLHAGTLEQLYAFGTPGRDPRGRTISIAYTGMADPESQLKAGDDAAETRWYNVMELPELAFDHREIIQKAVLKYYEMT
jgi:8-oxo-dGTP diphosphatase